MAGFISLRDLASDIPTAASDPKTFVTALRQRTSPKVVEHETRGQNVNNRWFFERVGRITSSRSHQVAHLRESTDTTSVLNSLFGCTDRSAPQPAAIPPVTAAPLAHGHATEPIARREYIQLKKSQGAPVSVSLSGLFVSQEHPWLASSPDGLVADNGSDDKFGILEIKCPFSDEPIRDIMKKSTSFPLMDSPDGLVLKTSHQYFSQVQHHMAVIDRSWCDFVMYTQNMVAKSRSIEVVRVKRSCEFWSEHFLVLEKFFHSVMIPDLVASACSL